MNDIQKLLEDYRQFASKKEAPMVMRPEEPQEEIVAEQEPLPMAKPLQASPEVVDYISQFEGKDSQLHDDYTGKQLGQADIAAGNYVGNPTLGGGKKLTQEELMSGKIDLGGQTKSIFDPINQSERNAIVKQGIDTIAAPIVEANAPVDLMSPEQIKANISRAYNLGNKAFGGTYGEYMELAKKYPDRASEFMRKAAPFNDEVKAGGQVLPGLVERRAQEQKDMGTVSSLADMNKMDRNTIAATEKAGREFGQPIDPIDEGKLMALAGKSAGAEGVNRMPASIQPPLEADPKNIKELLIQEYRKLMDQKNSGIDTSALDKAQAFDAVNNIASSLVRYGRNPDVKPGADSNFYAQELAKQNAVRDGQADQLRSRVNLLSSISNMDRLRGNGGLTRLGSKLYRMNSEGEPEVVATDELAEMDAKRRQDAFEFGKEKANRPSDKQTENFATIDTGISELKKVADMKQGVNTGPIAGRAQSKLVDTLGDFASDPKFVKLRQMSGLQLFDYIKAISGSAYGEKEFDNLKNLMPTVEDDDNAFMDKLNNVISRMEDRKKTLLNNVEKSGKNVDKFKDNADRQIAEVPNEVIRKTKDGREAIFDSKTKQFLRYK